MKSQIIRCGVYVVTLLFASASFAQSPGPVGEDAIEKCLRILRYGDVHHPYKPTKAEAVLALGLLGAEKAVPVLLEHLNGESNDNLRVQIVRALGWIRSTKAVPALKELTMKDRYLHVRRAAAEALREITGVEHQYDRTGEAEARKRVFDTLEAKRLEREKANKAPEPTPTSVTPRAIEGVSR